MLVSQTQFNEPFCPLYETVRNREPWKKRDSSHAGLLFDKFAHAWRRDRKQTYAFDKGDERTSAGIGSWMAEFVTKPAGSEELLTEACHRQRQLVESAGGKVLLLTNTSRFVTGMGREHPIENGFAWHHTLGVPYLPGSSLKGMLRGWLREEQGEPGKDKHGNDVLEEACDAKAWFGTQDRAGTFILLDMLPLTPPNLEVDVMTPHYGPYYQDGKPPGDWHSPVPISFLTVAPRTSWQIGILPVAGMRRLEKTHFEQLTDDLMEAIKFNGAGAKTAVGYGRFEIDRVAAAKRQQLAERQERADKEANRLAAEQAKFDASVADDSAELRELKTLRRRQQWALTAGDQNMLSALNKFAQDNTAPPSDALDWIRDLLESIPSYKGVWQYPREKRGKRKDKWKYPAKAVRDLVIRLNPEID